MSDLGKAVFLSYASQDTEAARRICDTLRAADVEVWFDQSELRGGDAWDQKIRRQIKECALFVPIISASTQSRAEGYFRLEWRLADQRTHLMGRNRAFVFPVCVDETPDAGADVPDSFLAAQWTRLPDGETSAAVAEHVRRLLAGEVTA
ncbi:MAG: toll/interleukin-1 receptor domain-containing protein, partial [Opitutales bacterium]